MATAYKTISCIGCKAVNPMVHSHREHYIRQFNQIESSAGKFTISVDEVYWHCCGLITINVCNEERIQYKGEKPSGLYTDEKNVQRYSNVGTYQSYRESLYTQLRAMSLGRPQLGLNSVAQYGRLSIEAEKKQWT